MASTTKAKRRRGARSRRAANGSVTSGHVLAFEHRTLLVQQVLVVVAVVAGTLAFTRSTEDIFGITKATVVFAATVAVLAVWAFRVVRSGRILVPFTRVSWPLGAFALLMFVSTFTSERIGLSIAGHTGRYTGLAIYLAGIVLFYAVLRAFEWESVGWIALGAGIAGLGVAVYGLLQAADADPISWSGQVGVTSTLGNPNYVAAHLGIALPLAAWGAITTRWPTVLRVLSGLAAVAIAVTIPFTNSEQGYAAAVAGLAVVAIAWLLTRDDAVRRYGLWAMAGAAGLGVVAIVLGLLDAGPLAPLFDQGSFQKRLYDWQAAIGMTADHPFLGVGFDRYGGYFHEYRPLASALKLSLNTTTSTPHSVHLNMFASGGVPLGLAYLAFVGSVGWVLVQGLRKSSGRRLLLLGGVGGAWLAYQAQSAISIDVPSLLVHHWVLAGAVVAVAAPPVLRELKLPWAPGAARRSGGVRDALFRGLAGAGAAVVLVALFWIGLWPFRADAAAATASLARGAERYEIALDHAQRAAGIATWSADYMMDVGVVHLDNKKSEQALGAFEEAAARDPRDIGPTVTSARLAENLEKMDVAERWFRRALELEPNDPELKIEAARFFMRIEEDESALGLLDDAVEAEPDNHKAWLYLGLARERAGDTAGAREAYEKVLELRPNNGRAKKALDNLGSSG